jgi:hypothetical protein
MQLLLSCVNEKNDITVKDKLIITVNTETKKVDWLNVNISESKDLIGTKAIAYSGDYLVVSVITKSGKDKLLIIDVVTDKHNISNCTKSKEIYSISSVFRGRFYVCSSGTNAMNQISLSPSTTNIIRDVNHYSFGKDIHFNSLINWNRRWYASFYGEGWKQGNFDNGAIVELSSNNRKIYSNINQPNSLFFNRNNELCFCESGRSLFHFGRKIIWTGRGYLRGVIEDKNENGYWIACARANKTISRLKFFNYDGDYLNSINLPYGYRIYDIVEAQGNLSKLL